MTSPHAADDQDEIAIRRIFGNDFVDWVMATNGDSTRTAAQRDVAAYVHQISKELATPTGVAVPAFLRLGRLTQRNPSTGKIILTELRLLAGGAEPLPPSPPDDPVLAALQAFAVENFGGILLGDSASSLGWGGMAREQMTRAIAEDPAFPFSIEVESPEKLIHLAPAEGIEIGMLGSSVVATAFRQAATRKAPVHVEDLLAELPTALDTARALFEGKAVQALALAGLAGVLLPADMPALTTPWGRVRLAHETDNPMLDRQQDMASMTQPDGSEVVSRGIGDLTIETTVPWSTVFTQSEAEGVTFQATSTTDDEAFQRRIQDVQLGYALAMRDPWAPALLPTWAMIESPVMGPRGFSINEIARLRQRTPTRLSVEQAEKWEEWITLLNGLPLENLGHAPQRLLRAITERQDPVDALVDAVIVWEAIFGTHSEITFRVCGSLARLLCDTIEERLAFVKKAKGVYGMRSKIVHGASNIKPEEINAARDEAVRIAIMALSTLVQNRPDLLVITNSSKRSDHIMLE